MSVEHLRQSISEAPLIKKGKYTYLVHPLTDGIPCIQPELLSEVVSEMKKQIQKIGTFDRIVTMEAMGIPLAAALSLKLNVPFTIIRKRSYGLPGEVSVEQVTGYSKSKMYINGLKKGDTVIIVDDVLSTGGTLKAVMSVLQHMGVGIKGVFIAVYKGICREEIVSLFHTPITTCIDIDIVDNTVIFK